MKGREKKEILIEDLSYQYKKDRQFWERTANAFLPSNSFWILTTMKKENRNEYPGVELANSKAAPNTPATHLILRFYLWLIFMRWENMAKANRKEGDAEGWA